MGSLSHLWAAFKRGNSYNIFLMFILIQAVAIAGSLLFPESFRYLSQGNFQVMLKAIPTLGIIAMGVNLLIICGEFDLSVGSTFALAALTLAKLHNAGTPIFLCFFAAIAVGLFIGFVNGYVTVKSNVPSFIITLGSMWFWRGIMFYFSQSQSEPFYPGEVFTWIFTSSAGVFQIQFLWFILVAICCWLFLERHKYGNHIFAVGGNRNAARALGINSDRIKIMTFMIVGGLAAFAAVISTTRVCSVSPIQGEGFEMQSIASCVIGGTALSGGRGAVFGAFLGAILLFVIENFLILLRAPGYYLKLFVGLIIVVAAVLNEFMKNRK